MESTEVKTPDLRTIKSAGPPERHDFSNQKPPVSVPEDNGTSAPPAAGGDDGETPEAKAAREAAEAAAKEIKLPELSDEQLKELFKQKGIEGFENFDTLKEKLAKANATVITEPTEEERKAAEAAFDQRVLNHFLATGGTAEAFVALKQIASMDLRELSVAELKKELKERNFNDAEIEIVVKERYYQLNPDELQKNKTYNETDGEWVEESDDDFAKRKDFLKRKVAAFSAKLDTRSTHTKQNAELMLNNLRDAVKAEDSKKKQEEQILSKVDEISSKTPREITFELGEINKIKTNPVVYKVSEADIAEVVAEFKDPARRQQILLNEDKTLNLTSLMELKLRNKYLESALKAAYIEGGNQRVAELEKVFPGSAKALGVGGSPEVVNKGRKGHIVSAGPPEVAVPQHR